MASMWVIRLVATLAVAATVVTDARAQGTGEAVEGRSAAESNAAVNNSPPPTPDATPSPAATPPCSPTSTPGTEVEESARSASMPIRRRDPRLPGELSWAIGLAPLPGLDLTYLLTRRTGIHGLVMGVPTFAYALEAGPRYIFSVHRTTAYLEGGILYGSMVGIFDDQRVTGVAGSAALGVEHQFQSRMTISAAGGVYFGSGLVPLLRLMFGYRF